MDKNSAVALDAIVQTPWWRKHLDILWKVIAGHLFFWILLVYVYPRSTQVQAFFFSDAWARRFLGLYYVDLLLTYTPFLRNRLLAPFREELIADARTGDDNLKQYFEDIEVQGTEGSGRESLSHAIPEVRDQIVFEGESGLGKSMFLRRLVKDTKAPIVYLPADNCDPGVFAAIQRRLKGKAGDEKFLKSIISIGGLPVVIDGLNEVTVETREKIRFLDDFLSAMSFSRLSHWFGSTRPEPAWFGY
jgi:hypothetical protein